MNNSQQLANLIKLRAKEVGKTLIKISEECEISKNFMQSMKNEGYMPRLENLCKLADSLDCSVDYLLGRTDEPNQKAEMIKENHDNNVFGVNAVEFTVPITTYPASSEQQQEIDRMMSDLSPRERNKLMGMIYDYYDECKKESE